jgi:hypothetical protein
MKKGSFITILLLVLLSQVVLAEEPGHIIANSQDWRDVYSVMLYGSLTGKSASFLVSDRHGPLLLNSIGRGTHIWSINSKKVPYVFGYKSLIESRGFTAESFDYENVNLELAKKLDVNNFIIIDDSYGYNAIAVAPYAVITKSYVLFVDKNNIREVDAFLRDIDVNKVIIYGHVNREVKNALARYSPEIINEGGDRFANNIEIVKKYQELEHAKQTILTNGEFIEKEIMSGTQPVIFIGTNNVPDIVRDYIRDSEIDIGVLIGNELVGTATFVKREIGISVFVKFAQGARAPRGVISQVEALDMFYLPVYTLNLEIDSMRYNKATKQLEVTLKNTEDQAVYAKGTYTLIASDGTRQTVGDLEPVFIDGKELKTLVYDVESMPEGEIQADVYILYGESKRSLEKVIDTTLTIDVVKVLDRCEIGIEEVSYNTRRKMFYVLTENIADVECYVDVELVDIVIAGEKNTFGMKSIAHLDRGGKKRLRVRAELEEEDLEDNTIVKVRAYYGERENSLIKVFEGTFELVLKGIDWLFYSLLLIIITLIILILWKRYREKKKEER